MRFTDPDGMFSTDVVQNDDGTYNVVGGDINDGDKNIYVVDDNDDLAGEIIGQSLTMESFYYSGTPQWIGTIDLNDKTGTDFINNTIVGNKNLGLFSYMWNATGGGIYDFKRLGSKVGDPNYSDPNYYYRGMPFGKDNKGNNILASARDIGNYAAGYLAGKEGARWWESRLAFDALQSWQERTFSTESTSTQLGQRAGWNRGINSFNFYIRRYKK